MLSASYIRTQATVCGLINLVLNPVLAWTAYRRLEALPVWGANSVVVDTAVTCVVLPLLVTICVSYGARRALRTGEIKLPDAPSRKERMLSGPRVQTWSFGFLLGVGAALLLVPLTIALFQMLGITGISLLRFLLFKALYTGALGFVVARWVIRRQLLTAPVHQLAQP